MLDELAPARHHFDCNGPASRCDQRDDRSQSSAAQLVALGVLEGDVLCAICDACLAHGSDADVVGIDWNESRPADAAPYETLAARVGRDYPFARVLQGDLHAFRQQVPDGAVDLLYINGRDPRARHQSLTTWATALSERGICIYDGRERPGDGHPVLPPWVDWALPYPSEMLELSGGLQILVVGAPPPAVRRFVTIWQRSAYLRELLQTSAALMASTFPACRPRPERRGIDGAVAPHDHGPDGQAGRDGTGAPRIRARPGRGT